MSTEFFTESYEKFSDVMFVNVAETPADADIDTIDIGEHVGFPGQIVVRIDANTGTVYGVIIERYSAVKKRLAKEEAKQNFKEALQRLLERILAAVRSVSPNPRGQLQHA